jgi:hypothetical protein
MLEQLIQQQEFQTPGPGTSPPQAQWLLHGVQAPEPVIPLGRLQTALNYFQLIIIPAIGTTFSS